jgi:hypothetical protein
LTCSGPTNNPASVCGTGVPPTTVPDASAGQ